MTHTRKIFKGGEYLAVEALSDDVFVPEDFSDEQKQLAETIDHFVANEVLPNVERLEHGETDILVRLIRRAGELGLMMIDAPEEYGGLELSKATCMLAAERISAYGGFYVSYMAHTGIGTLPLVYYGTKAQKEKYLSRLITGEMTAAYCLTEPGSGSDALGARTYATLSPDGRHYILNGTKQFITNGRFADLYTVFAKVGRRHFTAFLVERSFKGVSAGPEEKKMGIKGSSTTSVILEDAEVPVENVLGEIGKGHKIAFNVLNDGRFKLGAGVTGAAKHVLAEGVRYANQRKQFGVPISSFGAIKEKIADVTAAVFAAESLVYRLAGLLDDRLSLIPRATPGYYEAYQQGIEEYAGECAIAKVFCSETLGRAVDEVVQIHGGYGFVQDYPAERFYRDARVNRIFEGTNEINRILISRLFLKRAVKGEIPLRPGEGEGRDLLLKPSLHALDASRPFVAERALLGNLKLLFAAVAGKAVERFGDGIRDEQEILGSMADIAIGIFAIESSVARAGKIRGRLSSARGDVLEAALKTFVFNAGEGVAAAARRAAASIEERESIAGVLDGIQKLTRYDAPGLLRAKRCLADAVISAEKYVFGG